MIRLEQCGLKNPFYVSLTIIISLSISGCDCDWVRSTLKRSGSAQNGHYGQTALTLDGELPANFGIKAVVFYGPPNENLTDCRLSKLESRTATTHKKVDAYEANISALSQQFTYDIPLEYSIGLCSMPLSRIDLKINGTFGEKEWQTTYADGGLRLAKNLGTDAPQLNTAGVFQMQGKCEWLFQESKMHLVLDKLLKCKGVSATLSRDQISNKRVNLIIEIAKEERPYYDDTWIKFDNGWKPCLPKKGGWISCQSPPLFKTFQMNGKTCTLYPNCTE